MPRSPTPPAHAELHRARRRPGPQTAHDEGHRFQQRLSTLIAEVVDTDRRNGHLRSPVPDGDLPHVLVRVMESYVYLSLITGEEPDTARAARVIHALLPQS